MSLYVIRDNLGPDFEVGSRITDKITIAPPLSLEASVSNVAPLLGAVGISSQMTAYNAVAPVVWAVESATGDVESAAIDSSGLLTFDVPATFSNNGEGVIVVSGTDANGQKGLKQVFSAASNPIEVETLGGNDNLLLTNPGLIGKSFLVAIPSANRVFQDVAKTTPSNDGDPVSAVENPIGDGDIIVLAGNNPPTYSAADSDIDDQPALIFDAAQSQSLEYSVPSPPAVGSAFKVFALVSIDPLADDSNATIISSTLVANKNASSTNSWQISRDLLTDSLVFRMQGSYTNVVLGTATPINLIAANDTWSSIKDGQYHMIYLSYDGTTVKWYIDGQLTAQADPVLLPAGEHFKIFENRAGTRYLSGKMAEMIVAGATMTEEEAVIVQAYFLQKYGLDASLLAAPGPFAVESSLYGKASQFELQTLTVAVEKQLANGTTATANEFVFDTLNSAYYLPDNIPTPGIGVLAGADITATIDSVTAQIAGLGLRLISPSGQEWIVGVNNAGTLTTTQA